MNTYKSDFSFTLLFRLALFFALVWLVQPATVRAQWNTNGNDINNTNSGNVGVGTTSPGVKLDILSSINLIARFGSTSAAHTQVLIDAGSAYNSNLTLQRAGVSKWYMGNRASDDRLSFIESTGTVEILALLQNGKVGVGTTAPTARFHIMTAAPDGDALRIHRNANTNLWGVAQYFALNNSSGVTTDYAQISGGITSNTAGAMAPWLSILADREVLPNACAFPVPGMLASVPRRPQHH